MRPKLSQIALIFVLLMPLAWVWGLDQLYWAATLPFSVVLLGKGPLGKSARILLFLVFLFLVSQVFSLAVVVNAMRLGTFSRNLVMDAAGLLLFVGLVSEAERGEAEFGPTLLLSIAWVGGVIGFFGWVSAVSTWRLAFVAAIQGMIPHGLKGIKSIELLYQKGLGSSDFWHTFPVYRLSGFFSHPTSYAMALLVIVPAQIFCWVCFRGWIRAFLTFALVFSAQNFFFTYTRSAWVGFAVGGCVAAVLLASRLLSPRSRATVGVAVALLCALGAVGASWGLSRVNLGYDYTELTEMDENNLIAARGTGSLRSRIMIYMATLDQAGRMPLIGYGTQRSSIPVLPFPAGSHSTYLSILYKYGAIGLLIYLVFYLAIFGTFLVHLRPSAGLSVWLAAGTGLWIFVASLAHQILEELDLDTSALFLFWIGLGAVLGLVIQSSRRAVDAQPLTLDRA